MGIKKTSVLLLITSILLIVCSSWNIIWRILKLVLVLSGKAQEVINADYDFSVLMNTNTNIFSVGISVLNTFLIGITSFLQVISGVAGIVYAGFMLCGKRLKFIGVPSVLGVITLITGLLSALTTGFSAGVFMHIVLWCSLFAISLLYLIFSYSFFKQAPSEKEKI